MKDKIINALKFFVLVFSMVMGIYFTYGIVWLTIGLPLKNYCAWILFALSGLSTWGYIKWLSN